MELLISLILILGVFSFLELTGFPIFELLLIVLLVCLGPIGWLILAIA